MKKYDKNEVIKKILEKKLFDYDFYLEKNNDVKNSNVDPLMHYLNHGYKEGRNPSKKFNNDFYINKYLKDINPLIHYILYGDEDTEINPFSHINLGNESNKKFLTEDHINKLIKEDPYYEGRWEYYDEIIEIIEQLGVIGDVLELGPYKSPLIENEDVIDMTDVYIKKYPININSFYEHDCSVTPYPIENKKYDLIVACQVLEHLGIDGQQKKIFDEFERISNRVIISLPYKWYVPDMRDHHMIDEKMIDHWANNRKYIFQRIVGTRIIRLYEFD